MVPRHCFFLSLLHISVYTYIYTLIQYACIFVCLYMCAHFLFLCLSPSVSFPLSPSLCLLQSLFLYLYYFLYTDSGDGETDRQVDRWMQRSPIKMRFCVPGSVPDFAGILAWHACQSPESSWSLADGGFGLGIRSHT